MRTKQQIMQELLDENPSRFYTINEIQYEQTEAEFLDAIEKKAQMVYEQESKAAEKINQE